MDVLEAASFVNQRSRPPFFLRHDGAGVSFPAFFFSVFGVFAAWW
jgi:hypothetical protein